MGTEEMAKLGKKFNKIKKNKEESDNKSFDPIASHFETSNPDKPKKIINNPHVLNEMPKNNPKVEEAKRLLNMSFEDIMKYELGLEKDIIYCDTQEIEQTFNKGLELIPEMQRKKLKVFDIVYNDLGIERKTVEDFISSIIDGRLDFQCNKMVKYGYMKKIILIEGNYKEYLETEGGIHLHAYLAKKASISQKYDVEIQDVADNYDFWYTVKKLIEKNPKSRDLNIKVNIFDKHKHWNPEVAMLASGFEGIAEKKAELILSKYCIKDLYNISREDLEKIAGIGPKISGIIKEHFN